MAPWERRFGSMPFARKANKVMKVMKKPVKKPVKETTWTKIVTSLKTTWTKIVTSLKKTWKGSSEQSLAEPHPQLPSALYNLHMKMRADYRLDEDEEDDWEDEEGSASASISIEGIHF